MWVCRPVHGCDRAEREGAGRAPPSGAGARRGVRPPSPRGVPPAAVRQTPEYGRGHVTRWTPARVAACSSTGGPCLHVGGTPLPGCTPCPRRSGHIGRCGGQHTCGRTGLTGPSRSGGCRRRCGLLGGTRRRHSGLPAPYRTSGTPPTAGPHVTTVSDYGSYSPGGGPAAADPCRRVCGSTNVIARVSAQPTSASGPRAT